MDKYPGVISKILRAKSNASVSRSLNVTPRDLNLKHKNTRPFNSQHRAHFSISGGKGLFVRTKLYGK